MPDKHTLIEQIDAVLPQIHCGKCGFDGCRPYAMAIVEGRADIDQCPPGSDAVIVKLATILNVMPKPLNTAYGHPTSPAVAIIDETQCIGCTFCLRACPVDAIVGAAKHMHTVLTDICTGCERCIAPCPMDCISMEPVPAPATPEIRLQSVDHARERYRIRSIRLARDQRSSIKEPEQEIQITNTSAVTQQTANRKQAIIQAAIERARAAHAQANFSSHRNKD